jgi:hypothetical protein
MNATRSKSANPTPDEAPATVPQTTPVGIGYGHPEYSFIQISMELQKSVTRMETVLEEVRKTTDDTKAKVSRFEKIIYAAGVVLVVGLAIGGWMLNTAKDFAMAYFKASIEAQSKSPAHPW